MLGSFTVCSSRSTPLIAVDLCPTMDLIVVLSSQGTLTVYRTLSWEKVLSKSSSELTGSGTSIPRAVSFCLTGRSIAIGCNEGDLLVLDIATGEVLSAFRLPVNTIRSAIIQVAWVQHIDPLSASSDSCQLNGRGRIWRYGGVNLVDRSGMEEHLESGLGEIVEIPIVESLFRSTESSIMLSLNVNRELSAFIFGIFPLFSVSLNSIDRIVGGITHLDGVYIVAQKYMTRQRVPYEPHDGKSDCRKVLKLSIGNMSCLNCRFRWLEHAASLHLMIHADFSKLQDMVASHGRKWKDSTRVIIPKLSLLQGVLDSYQMGMSPVQFMYSVSHCGLWHPAALTAFSQHWNEQGVSRLRSAVETASSSTRKALQMRATPIATNIALRCRELLGLQCAVESCSQGKSPSPGDSASATTCLRALVRSSELLLFKLDDTLQEARAAQEAMMVYLQFIKECSVQTAAASAPLAGFTKWNPTMTPKYLRIFDPRSVRAAGNGPQAQAEAVTSTHLYAYLQDQDLPPALVQARQQSRRKATPDDRESIQDIFQIAEKFAANESAPGYEEQYGEFSRRSLLQEVKSAKEVFMRAFHHTHAAVSADMAASCSSEQQDKHRGEVEIEWLLDSRSAANIVSLSCPPSAQLVCAHDALVTNLDLCVRSLALDCLQAPTGSESSVDMVEEDEELLHKVCPEGAILTAAVITSPSDSVDGANLRSDLVVLCRPLSPSGNVAPLYCARVCLTSNHLLDIVYQIGGVQMLRIYTAPPIAQQNTFNTFPDSAPHDFEYLKDSDSIEGSGAAEYSDRRAAIVGVARAKGAERADPNPLSSCLFRVELKDLHFTDVSDLVTAPATTSSLLQPNCVGCVCAASLLRFVAENPEGVRVRERLLAVELPEDSSRIILEACAARGVVLVGVSSDGAAAGRIIVVDMEMDEEEDDDQEEESDDNGEGDKEDDDDESVTVMTH